MSVHHYFRKASKKEDKSITKSNEPVVNRFSDIQAVDERRHRVLDHLLMDFTAKEIAEFMNEEEATIFNDIRAISTIGYQAREEDINDVRDEIMKTYRIAKKEGYKAFKKSQGVIEKTSEEAGTGANGMFNKSKVVREDQAGDPRFLNVMLDAAKEMGKVSGAQKHKEFEVQNTVQNNTLNILSPNRTEMPDDFNRWTKKPDDAEVPNSEGIKSEDL